MLKKINLFTSLIIIGLGLFVGYLIIANAANAQTESQAQTSVSSVFYSYPIKELGDCQDEASCRAFCDNSENISACVSFAQKHNLISKEEAKKIKTVDNVKSGPGGCRGKEQCAAFCDDPSNVSACLDFAEKNNLMSQEELKEARQVAQALSQGAQLPGDCKNKKDCEAYCNDSTHINECLNFAEKAGFMSEQDLKEARQVAKAISSGINPPGNCKSKNECETYCSDASHSEECLAFAEAAGFIPKEDVSQARKMMSLMNSGQTPGNCKSKDQCESYCADASHSQECADFAVKAGLMDSGRAEIFKRTGGKGPGGCQGKDECEAFCNDSKNQETCFDFADKNNLIPPEEIQNMQEGASRIKENISNMPPEVLDCLKSSLGTEIIDKMQKGELAPGPQIGASMRQCFEKSNPAQMMPASGTQMIFASGTQMMPPSFNRQQGDFKGLGGCQNFEECKSYCQNHLEECIKFGQREKFKYHKDENKNEGTDENTDEEDASSSIEPSILMPDSASGSIQWMPRQMPQYDNRYDDGRYQQAYPTGAVQFQPSQDQMPPAQGLPEPTSSMYYAPTEQPSTSEQTMPSIIKIFMQVFKGVLW